MKFAFAFTIMLAGITIAAAQKRPLTIYIAGDSTAANKLPEKRPETGWGEMLQKHFDEKKVKIENHAQNGRSTKTFLAEGRWQAIVDRLQKGDYVFVQFGHNDESKEKGERYTPPEDFRKNLIRFIADVRAKKANIVLLTPVMRRKFNIAGTFVDQHPPEYPAAFRTIAKEQNVPLIDMHRKSEAVIKRYGVEGSRALFLQLKTGENANYPNGVEDNTHFVPKGADEMADLVVEGIKENKLSLKKYLK